MAAQHNIEVIALRHQAIDGSEATLDGRAVPLHVVQVCGQIGQGLSHAAHDAHVWMVCLVPGTLGSKGCDVAQAPGQGHHLGAIVAGPGVDAGVDLQAAVEAKMKTNKGRSHRKLGNGTLVKDSDDA